MKKALVILLALTMVLSCMAIVPFGASAEDELAVGAVAEDYKPEGTAVSTAAEFAGMAADGTYYLAADITLDATYAANFTGTLDGNGKVITTKVPVFDQFNGTAMNLTLKGYIETTTAPSWGYAGTLANAAGTVEDTAITNVCNMVTMDSASVGQGGIVGRVAKGAKTTTTFTDCANYGQIANGKNSTTADNGGIVGCADAAADKVGIVMTGCANYGFVDTYGRVGGLLGAALCSGEFVDCVNEGEVNARNGAGGGIVGRVTSHTGSYKDTYLFENCVNRGEICGAYNNGGVGGIVGFSGAADELIFKGCVNYGDIDCHNYKININMGGILGGCDEAGKNPATKVIFENCINHGMVGSEADIANRNGGTSQISRSGGIAGHVYVNVSGSETKFAYCYNYGDIWSKFIAGGIAGAGMAQACPDISFTACGNFGNVKASGFQVQHGSRVGGIVGHLNEAVWAAPKFTYCFNLGSLSSSHFVGGIAGWSKCIPQFEYNYVAGEIESTREILDVVAQNYKVSGGSHSYSYEGATGTRYFRAPTAGVVAISGDKVTFTANTALAVAGTLDITGGTVAGQKVYTFEHNGQKYGLYAPVAGNLTIDVSGDFPTATVAGWDVNVIEWVLDDTNKVMELETYDHPVRTAALVFAESNGFYVDVTKNFIQEDVADMAAMQGFARSWWQMSTNTADYVGTPEADFASGKVAGELNAMSGENIFRQNLNAQLFEVDAYPTTDATHAKVVNIGGVYSNQLFDVDNDAGSPATGDAIVYVVVALAVSAVAVVTLATVAVAKKRKEN